MIFNSNFIRSGGTTARGKQIYVETPRGRIVEVRHRDGTTGMSLKWANDFSPRHTEDFKNAQEFIDSECIRCMNKYAPMRNGILVRSAVLGTRIGSGKIYQVAPYARYQYYGKLMVSRITGSSYARQGESKVLTDKDLQYSTLRHQEAQKLWFEKMKTEHGEAILRGAARIAGGKPK